MSDQDIVQAPEPPPPAADAAEGKMANIVYILYLLSIIFGITALIGVVMAYVFQGDAPDWARTHYRFQIRTFWIGLVGSIIAVVTTWILIGWLLLLLLCIWWIVRCVIGMKHLSRGEAHPNPASWLFN